MKFPPVTTILLADANMDITESLYRDPEPYVGDDYKLIVSLKDRWKVLGVRSWSNATWKFRLHDYRGPSCVLAVNCHSEFKCLGRLGKKL